MRLLDAIVRPLVYTAGALFVAVSWCYGAFVLYVVLRALL